MCSLVRECVLLLYKVFSYPICIYIFRCIHTGIYIYAYTYSNVFIQTYIYIDICIYIYIHTCLHAYIHTCIHTYTHTHTHTHIDNTPIGRGAADAQRGLETRGASIRPSSWHAIRRSSWHAIRRSSWDARASRATSLFCVSVSGLVYVYIYIYITRVFNLQHASSIYYTQTSSIYYTRFVCVYLRSNIGHIFTRKCDCTYRVYFPKYCYTYRVHFPKHTGASPGVVQYHHRCK